HVGLRDPEPQQVDFGGTAGEELASRVGADGRDRFVHVSRARVANRPRDYRPSSRTSRIASRIFGYAAQRQMLPLMYSAMSSSCVALPSLRSATADMIWPELQYPHWTASCSMNAFCIGWRSPPSSDFSPSIVVT